MESKIPVAIDWESIKPGTMLTMKDFPTVKLMKLDNSKGVYFGYDVVSKVVDVKEYISEEHGGYMYFQTYENDWHPLTTRLWNV
jgi:hypothetical protein